MCLMVGHVTKVTDVKQQFSQIQLKMGAQTSKSDIFLECMELFSEGEQKQMTEIYLRICDNSKDGFSETDLMKYGQAYLAEPLLTKLFYYMKTVVPHSPGDKDNELLVTDEEFLVALSHILKGSLDKKSAFLVHLSTGVAKGSVSALQLKQTLGMLMESYRREHSSVLSSWNLSSDKTLDSLCQFVLHELVYKGEKKQCDVDVPFPWDSVHNLDAVESWLSRSALTLLLLDDVFHRIFSISAEDAMLHQIHLIPRCENSSPNTSTILDLPSLMFLNRQLLPELQNVWRFLFSARRHGESFATLMKNIVDKGPTLIIVEDADGYVFGGFASVSWKYTSQFMGTSQSFLFSLQPLMDVYQTTGYNENYQYLNHGQETIPNGLGMGGQLDYFGLWLDAEFGKGHSKANPRCTTYKSPQLSKSDEFSIRSLEVWALGPERKRDSQEPMDQGSILDKDPAAQAMLTLLNRGPLSDGLREEDPMADIPGEHHLRGKP